jgi:hypothetical protein
VHRGDDDDAAVARGAQRGPRVPREEEGAREQERNQGVPAVLVELLDGRDVLEPGVGDQGVETSEALEGGLDRRPVALARRQVGGEGRAGTCRIGLEVDREDVPAVNDEALRDGAADAARCARDDRRLAQRPPGCGIPSSTSRPARYGPPRT